MQFCCVCAEQVKKINSVLILIEKIHSVYIENVLKNCLGTINLCDASVCCLTCKNALNEFHEANLILETKRKKLKKRFKPQALLSKTCNRFVANDDKSDCDLDFDLDGDWSNDCGKFWKLCTVAHTESRASYLKNFNTF